MRAPFTEREVCSDCGDLFPALKEGRCELCYALDFWNWLKDAAEAAEAERKEREPTLSQ